MKIKNIVGLLLIAAISTNLTSCSSEEENIEVQEVIALTPEVSDLKIVVGKSQEIKITQGNGDYKAFSLNPEIVDVKLENGKILVEGKKNGITSIIISDQSNQYKKISITSYYESILTDQDAVDIKMLIGNPKTHTITITGGNDGYTVSTDNKDILSISVSKNLINIVAKKEGTANITIKDELELTKVIGVKITTTDVAFEESDLNAIKENSTSKYVFCEKIFDESYYSQYEYYNDFINGQNRYGFNEGWEYFKILFSGDKSVGIKENAQLGINYYNYETYESTSFTNQPIKFEIIKNDGKKIWAIYTFTKNGRLYYGHLCQNINP